MKKRKIKRYVLNSVGGSTDNNIPHSQGRSLQLNSEGSLQRNGRSGSDGTISEEQIRSIMRNDCKDDYNKDTPITHNPIGRPREYHGFFSYGYGPCLRSTDTMGKAPLVIIPTDEQTEKEG